MKKEADSTVLLVILTLLKLVVSYRDPFELHLPLQIEVSQTPRLESRHPRLPLQLFRHPNSQYLLALQACRSVDSSYRLSHVEYQLYKDLLHPPLLVVYQEL